MRIIGGEFGGVGLFSPKGSDVRPTSDRAREALFNIIGDRIEGARLLDLFGGSGAVALEALSRGAAHVSVVELKHIDLIRRNAAKCGVTPSARFHVIRGDAFAAVDELDRRGERFDLVYADPPWGEGLEQRLADEAPRLLKAGGWLILESFFKMAPPTPADQLCVLAKSRRYGDTVLHFYERPSRG